MTLEKGKKVWIKTYKHLNTPELHKVKIIWVKEVDGRKIVRYRHNMPFPIYEDEYIDDFIKIMAK